MGTNITVMPTMDMTSDETRIYHVVEWITKEGEHRADAYCHDDTRDMHAQSLAKGDAQRIVTYNIVCPFGTANDEAEDYIRDNGHLIGYPDRRGPIHEVDRREMEIAIVTKLVNTAIELGYSVSVYDGEAYAISRSKFALNILAEMFATDEEFLQFYSEEFYIGGVDLVYGNEGWTVIADHNESAEMAAILAPAETLAAQFEEQHA